MGLTRVFIRRSAVAVALALSFAASSSAQPNPPVTSPTIHIDNFGKINDHYYRGAQPDGRDYTDLAALGVRTVIDLTRDGRSDEPGLVERAGMKFLRIPLTTSDRPADAAVAQFLTTVNDPMNQPVYVHCQGGRHRTGVMTAVYRMTEDGWTADQAFAEMRRFNFDSFPGHPTLKSFVFSYYSQVQQSRAAGTQPHASAASVR